MSKLVNKNDDISSVVNGKFVYCKELKKGFIKRDISSLNSTTFEAVVNEIEALDLNTLETLGLDSVVFGDNYSDKRGEILASYKLEESIKNTITNMNASDISNFLDNKKHFRRYFDVDSIVIPKVMPTAPTTTGLYLNRWAIKVEDANNPTIWTWLGYTHSNGLHRRSDGNSNNFPSCYLWVELTNDEDGFVKFLYFNQGGYSAEHLYPETPSDFITVTDSKGISWNVYVIDTLK